MMLCQHDTKNCTTISRYASETLALERGTLVLRATHRLLIVEFLLGYFNIPSSVTLQKYVLEKRAFVLLVQH